MVACRSAKKAAGKQEYGRWSGKKEQRCVGWTTLERLVQQQARSALVGS